MHSFKMLLQCIDCKCANRRERAMDGDGTELKMRGKEKTRERERRNERIVENEERERAKVMGRASSHTRGFFSIEVKER